MQTQWKLFMIDNGVIAELQKRFAAARDSKISEAILSKVAEWKRKIPYRLISENPLAEYQDALEAAQDEFRKNVYELPSITSDLASYKKLAASKYVGESVNETFWKEQISEIEKKQAGKPKSAKIAGLPHSQRIERRPGGSRVIGGTRVVEKKARVIVRPSGKQQKSPVKDVQSAAIISDESEKLAKEKKILRDFLQDEWRKMLDKAYARWKLAQLAEYRRQLIAELEKWLELIQQLADAMDDLCIEPGLLFDLSKGNLSPSDIEQVKQWAEYLSEDAKVRELCEMLGRMRVAAAAKRTEIIRTTEIIPETRVDINSREEISGVEAGDSLEHVLPQEKALLADEDTADLFYLKFAEKRLMQFVMTGKQTVDVRLEKEEEHQVEEKEKTGPIIVCVDTSGSMQGTPETVAKAVALYMATSAMNQNRDCFLINYSTEIETMELSGQNGFAELIGFLKMSFSGGTDAAPAVKRALKTMQEEKYKNADLLVVSDFVMPAPDNELRAKISVARENGNKFHALAVCPEFNRNQLKDIFDNEWVFNPQTGVRSLLDFADAAGGQKYL